MDTRYSGLAGNHPGITLKWLVDLLGAVAGLVLFAPLGLLVAVLIRLESGSSVLFRQERIGYGGQRFWMLKFRSMPDGAEELLNACLQAQPDRRQEYDQYQKLYRDLRLTHIGRLLRRFSLDRECDGSIELDTI